MSLDTFFKAYRAHLERVVAEYPTEYVFPPEQVPMVAERMRRAFFMGSYNKDGRAIKATCRELGIKHTYKAIDAFIQLKEAPPCID